MNNLHRELAPISDEAWASLEEETTRTLKRYLAGRRVVDVEGPGGLGLSAVGTGHLKPIAAPGEGVLARQREVKPLVEFRVPFVLDRQQIDDVERGAEDSDWQPAKDAAQKLAYAEDRAIFEGYAAAGVEGVRQGTSNPIMTLPADVRQYPDAIASALSQLRLVGVNGPYSVVLGADAYTALSETVDNGYPVLEHVKKLVKDEIVWAPAIDGAFVLTTRGGDFDLHIGQDVSIGYLSHDDSVVRLYLQETLTFLMLTSEASVALAPPATKLPQGDAGRWMAAYISAFAALAGTAIGGLASFTTSWVTQNAQTRAQRRAAERDGRAALFGRFLDEAAKLYSDALQTSRDDVSGLIGIYALTNRIRLLSTPEVVEAADTVVRIIVDTYLAPNITLHEMRTNWIDKHVDPLRDFSEACRKELQTF